MHTLRKAAAVLLILGVLVGVWLPPAFAASFTATITWVDNSTNESGFRVLQKEGATGTYAVVGQVNANVVTYTALNLAVSTQYCYKIEAWNAVNALQSPEACATTGAPVTGAPGAPTVIFQYVP